MLEYIDVELSIKKVGNYYKVEIETFQGKTSKEIHAQLSPLDIPENHIIRENELIDYGTNLFNTFITGDIKTAFDDCYSVMEKEGKILKLLLETDADSGKFFWELLYHNNYFLCLHPEISFARVISPKDMPVTQVDPPLEILLVASNPLGLEEELNLYYERDTIKWELKNLEDSGLLRIFYTDISNAKTINDKLKEGFHIFHYSGHGTIIKDIPLLLLEDKKGYRKPTKVTDLQPSIVGNKNLKIVIFDACKLAPAAEKILQFGIPAFIGMQGKISDDTATTFFEEFYRVLGTGETIDVAFKKARCNVIAEYGINTVDWAIPVLFLSTNNTEIFEIQERAKKEKLPENDFSGLPAAPKFVGRREKIREIVDSIADEDIKVVMVHGYSGVGKTSLVSKVLRELQGYYMFSVPTPSTFNFGEFFEKFHMFLVKNGIYDLSEYEKQDILGKIEGLISLLSKKRIIIAFDGFEDQVEHKEIKDEGIRLFLERVVTTPLKGKVVVTSKVAFDILEGRLSGCIGDISLDGFYEEESSRYLNNFGLKGLGEDERRLLHRKTDGHPYALEIFVGLTKRFTIEELFRDESLYVGEIEVRFVGKLLSSLNSEERETLSRCAVFDIPVPLRAFEFVGAEKEVISDLVGVNLVKFDQDLGVYKVHSTTRDVVLSELGEEVKELHMKAGQFWEMSGGHTGIIWDWVKAQDHYYQAEEYKRAGEIVNNVAEFLYMWGYIRLLEVLLERLKDKTEELVKAGILHHLGITAYSVGEYEKAVSNYEESLKIKEELEDKRGIAITLHQIGMVHHVKGEYEKAVSNYEESLKIKEELGDKRGIAITLHQIGMVHHDKGEYEKAVSNYEESLKIEEELGDKRGIASTLGQISKIHLEKRNFRDCIKLNLIILAIFKYLESPSINITMSDLQKVRETIGKQEFDKLSAEVLQEVEIYLETLGLSMTL